MELTQEDLGLLDFILVRHLDSIDINSKEYEIYYKLKLKLLYSK